MTQSFLLAISFALISSSLIAANDQVRIELPAEKRNVFDKEITIGDIAKLSGGLPKTRRVIEQLDLDTANLGQTTLITRRQIQVRLQLAGVNRKAYEILGPDQIEIERVRPADLKIAIEDQLADELSQQFGLPQSDIQIRINDRVSLDNLSSVLDVDHLIVDAVFPASLPLGERTISVDLKNRDTGFRLTVQLPIQIVVLREVVVASSAISRGTVIQASHVQAIKRPFNDNRVSLVGMECIGRVASRDIPPYTTITTQWIKDKVAEKPIVVKSNALVDVLLSSGPLQIRVKNAKALTSGQVGQTIQVLNTESGKRINAVVLDQSTVVVRN